MPGKGSPPGEALYPECRERAGLRGPERHRRERTVPCVSCRGKNTRRSAAYRKRRLIEGRLKVPSLGAHRRVRALMRIGWPMRELEQRWGMGNKTLSQVLLRSEITRDKADRIAAEYARLAYLGEGPDQRTRMWAERRGWPGPLDWGEDIDSPDAVPFCEIEEAHGQALAVHREFKKMIAKREKRARMSEAERREARRAQAVRRSGVAA